MFSASSFSEWTLCCDSCLAEDAVAADRSVCPLKSVFGFVQRPPGIHVVSPEWFYSGSSSGSQLRLTPFILVFLSELPYGWEKIDDPIYGSYYVE